MDSERLARVKRKLEALNYDGDLDPKSAPLAEKLVDDLLNATNSYKSLKLRLTKQSKAQDNWEAKLMTLKQENAALLEENSQLRLQLIHNDELCDEKLRRAFAESCKLQRSVTELKFWKEQAIQRNVQFERLHDEIRGRLKSGNYQVVSTEQDAQARMELTAMLDTANIENHRNVNVLISGADDRAAALQERLAHADHELKRMHEEVAAAKAAVASREGEVIRLHSLLDKATDVDHLALKIESETKDALIVALSQQVEELNARIVKTESGCEEHE